MPAGTQNLYLLVLTKPLPCQKSESQNVLTNPTTCLRGHKTCIWTSFDQTRPLPTRTLHASQLVLTITISCQLGHKMYFNLSWLNPSNATTLTRCTSTSVDQTPHLKVGHKMNLNLCWPNLSHASEDTNCIWTCVDQISSMLARAQIAISTWVQKNRRNARKD